MTTVTANFKTEKEAIKLFNSLCEIESKKNISGSLKSFAHIERTGTTVAIKSTYYSASTMQSWIDVLYLVYECKEGKSKIFASYQKDSGFTKSRLSTQRRKAILQALKETDVQEVYSRNGKFYKFYINGVEHQFIY